jgi:hypothetical protein
MLVCSEIQAMGTPAGGEEAVVGGDCFFPLRYKQVVLAVLIVKVPVPQRSVSSSRSGDPERPDAKSPIG